MVREVLVRQTFGLRYLETLGSMRALDDALSLSLSLSLYRLVQKKGTVLLSTRLAWPAVAGCSRADTFSQLSPISFAQPCTKMCRILRNSELRETQTERGNSRGSATEKRTS